ncbi:MAG: glycosyltransferase family 4 protein, partial [bacterium]
ASALQRRGHRNIVVCRRREALEKASGEAGLETLNLPFFFEWDPVSALILRTRIKNLLNDGTVVLHAHTGHAAAVSRLAAAGKLCPRVVHRRVDFPVSNSLSIRAKYSSADALIAISGVIRDMLIAAGMPGEKISLIPSSIPSAGFPWDSDGLKNYRKKAKPELCRMLGIPPETPLAGSLIALVPHKDPANFINAAPKVLNRFPSAHFVIAGDGPLLESLQRLASGLKIAHRVHFTGFTSRSMEIMAALDAFVLPSWGEGMGSVLLEAMAAGTPIAATKAGGIPEVVENGVSGLLVPPRDPAALAEAVTSILSGNGLSKKLTEGGLRRMEMFSSAAMAVKTEELYEKTLHSRMKDGEE